LTNFKSNVTGFSPSSIVQRQVDEWQCNAARIIHDDVAVTVYKRQALTRRSFVGWLLYWLASLSDDAAGVCLSGE